MFIYFYVCGNGGTVDQHLIASLAEHGKTGYGSYEHPPHGFSLSPSLLPSLPAFGTGGIFSAF